MQRRTFKLKKTLVRYRTRDSYAPIPGMRELDAAGYVRVTDATVDQPNEISKTVFDALVAGGGGSGSGAVAAPATLDGSNVATYNGQTVNLASGGTLTVSDAAWAGLTGGLTINVGQSAAATLAFTGTATKENSAGVANTSVTLAASGIYVLVQSPTGTPRFRLSGGATL